MKKHLAYSVSLVLSFAINVIFMNMGIFNISQHLFYIPILLGVFFYGKKGVYFSALTSICYFISVAIFDKDSSEMLATFLRVVIFIAIAVLIYFLNTRYKTARAKLDSFFKINADMMCTFDKNLNFINVNKAFQNTLGYHRSEIEDHKLFDFIHPLDVDEILAKISEEKENTEFVCRVKCKDGSYKNIEWRSFYYDNVIYATPRDITDRIKLISQLKNDEYRINIVENLAKVGSWEIDILTKYCVYSSGFYSIFGIKPENGVTSSEQLKKFVCPEDFDYVYKKFQKAFEDRRDYSFECRIKRNDDNITWVHSKGTFKVDKETGRTKHVGFVMDITDHKLAEKMQINSLKRYASLTEISRFEADSDEKLLNYIILQAVELTDSNFGFLLKCDEKNRYFIVATKLWNTDKFIIGFDESEILKRVIETKKPIIVNKVKRSDLSCFGNIEAERLMITPVHEGDSITAVAIVYDKKASYDETDSLQFMLFIRNAWEQVKRKRAENELVEEKKWFETTLMSIGEGVIATDGNGVIQLVNEIAVKLTGIAKSDAIGKKIWDVYNVIKQSDKEQLVISKVLMGTDRETEIDEDLIFETKYGYPIDIEVKASAIKVSDKIAGYVIIFRDVTEKKESEREIAYLTYHDKLTGLYNRRFFEEELKKMDKVENYPISILVGDVNGLKLINDAFGHLAGDSLLIAAGEIMKSVCHAGDIAARWGGDEFIILMPRTETEAAEQVAENIKKICASTFVSNVNLSIALGSATKHSADDDIHEIIKQADDTMYKSKLLVSRNLKNNTVNAILKTLFQKDSREENHSIRVGELCKLIGHAMGLSRARTTDLALLGMIHDIGKISIDDNIIGKTEKLTSEEYDVIKRHSETGYHIISASPELSYLSEYVLAHHERWDGNGYPNRIIGKDIPLFSRILAVADAYEAITSDRSYHKAKSSAEALAEIKRCSGTQFDPDIVDAFFKLMENK